MQAAQISEPSTARARSGQSGRSAPKPSESAKTPPVFASDEERIASFGRALDALKGEVEAKLGEEDARHILAIGALSRRLEIAGRVLLQLSFEPALFSLGTAALWAHKTLELMEIGHPALHGCYDGLPGADRFQADTFAWKSPVDEASWRRVHNGLHHQYTNIEGRDPDLNFAALRLSARVPHRLAHLLQPISNAVTFFGFGTALNLQVTGMLDVYLQNHELQVLPDKKPATVRAAKRAFLSKFSRYYGKEYVLFPLLAGPFFGKVLLGNVLSEVARDVYAAAIIYCGHVGARDYPRGTEPATRAHWYALQAEGTRDVELPKAVSILCGALDKQIEHHLFPRLPPNRLREIAPRVRAICDAHGIVYRTDSWPKTLWSVARELARLALPNARPEAASPSFAA